MGFVQRSERSHQRFSAIGNQGYPTRPGELKLLGARFVVELEFHHGLLVNLEGQFVGMPTAVLRQSRSGAPVEGIAFALPSNRVLEIANAIIRNGGSPIRPTLGLEHLDISDEVTARIPRLAVQDGAVVISVAKGGPAEAAKIEAGDILTSVGGIAVTRNAPLLNALAKLSPEQAVKVVLNRQGKIIEAEVRLGKR